MHYLATGDVDGEVQKLTIADLDRAARAIAAHLQSIGAQGERALLVYAPGLDFVAAFLGCLYAGVVAVPAYPPDPMRMSRTLPRLRAIVRDSGTRYFLTTSSLQPYANAMIAEAPELGELRPITTDTIDIAEAERWQEVLPPSTAVAFLQYTSGSTGTPRGVMITHGNLVHNVQAILTVCPDPAARMVSWLPSYHDMGLIGCILTPLYGGFDAILMAPTAFLERPLRWLEAMSHYRASATAFPNFALDLCVRRATDADIAKLDLSKWKFGMNGAEPVRRASLERFTQRFAPCGFRPATHFPGYGLAEGTLLVAASRPRAAITYVDLSRDLLAQRRIGPARAHDSVSLVACGMAFDGEEIAIVNPDSRRRVGVDEVGEIWVRGASVGTGYWGRPHESERTFGARIAGTDEGPFLRTGDLGFLREEELFLVGRLKDVVIIRGENYYPPDIEETLESSHPGLRPGASAAVMLEVDEQEHLGIVAEVRRGMLEPELDAVVQSIRESVSSVHGIAPYEIALLGPGALPKTSSGKVQRFAARQGLMDGTLETVFSWSSSALTPRLSGICPVGTPRASAAAPADQRLATIDLLRTTLAAILGIDRQKLDADREFAALGADSLQMVELLHSLQERFGAQVTPAVVFENPTLTALARALTAMEPAQENRSGQTGPAAGSESSAPITAVHTRSHSKPFPLTLSQQALWFLHRLAPTSSAYHVALLFERSEGWDAKRARRAVESVLERHEVLSQRLVYRAEGLRHEPGAALEWNEHEALDVRKAVEKPFDLAEGSCLRVDFTPRAILFTVHHAVFDGHSSRVLLEDFQAAYEGRELAAARSYRDFVRWQNEFLSSAEAERQERYWLERFAALPKVIDLPGDGVRPARSRYRGDTVSFRVKAPAVQRLARELATTPSAVLLSAFFALQHRYTALCAAESDLVIGTPLFGRTQRGFDRTIGYCVNMAAVRESVPSDLPFSELLGRISKRVREALAHGDYPFTRLIEKLSEKHALPRDPARSPLFQTCFAFQGRAGLPPGVGAVSQQEGQFDVELELFDEGDEYAAHWKFDRDLFTRETATRMAAHYDLLLAAAIAEPETPVGKLPYLTAEEHALTLQVNATEVAFDASPLAIHGAPNDVALVFPGGQWSYGELEARVRRLARELADRGVGPEAVVGVCLPRGPELVLAIHAILHAGGAYLPIDPDWPDERIALVLRDARPLGVFAPASFARFGVPVLSCGPLHGMEPSECFESRARAESLAYVLYTSGSTGQPKGVLTEHRALANRVRWMQSRYPLSTADAVLQKTPFTFDVSVWEFMWPLSVGARLVVPPPHAHLDVSAMEETFARDGITTCHFVPSMLGAFLSLPPLEAPALRQVFVSGEALKPELVSRFLAAYPAAKLHNLYGPTEAAIDVSYWECRAEDSPVPIGFPVANTRIHVLDSAGAEAGLYVPGELVLAGKQLARGYLNRPELTAEKFCQIEGLGRVYRTGDLGRRRSDGAIEFLGRRDTQVKLRGVRIELGELEATLSQHPGVKALAVAVHGDDPESERLVAHVVGDADERELARFAKERLPRPLVPSQFAFHDALPLTPSGKLDRAQLRAPLSAACPRTEAAVSPIEQVFARFVPMQGLDTDFFRAGGTSLHAIRLVEALRRECGIDTTLMDFYAGPTPRAVLEKRATTGTPDLTAIAQELRARLPTFEHASRTAPRHVLLTGATGFFGRYLVREWLNQSDATLYCLVRGGASRLPSHPRVVPVEGDLGSLPTELADRIDTVVHNAARVHFLEPYQSLKAANVDGTLAILNFCAIGRPKRLHYVSTVSVFSGSDYGHDDRIGEDASPSPEGLSSGYAATKWVAEQLVLAARERGLAVTLFRPGTLAGDSRTGSAQREDFFARLLVGARQIGVLPELDSWIAFLPVDWAARALVTLALAGSCENYHLCHPEPISLHEFARQLRLGVVPLAEFRSRLEACSENALHPFLPLFGEPRRGPEEESEARLSERLPRLETRHLLADLARLWPNASSAPAMNAKLLNRYVAWLENAAPVSTHTLQETVSAAGG